MREKPSRAAKLAGRREQRAVRPHAGSGEREAETARKEETNLYGVIVHVGGCGGDVSTTT